MAPPFAFSSQTRRTPSLMLKPLVIDQRIDAGDENPHYQQFKRF
jgi:hypothetical protein